MISGYHVMVGCAALCAGYVIGGIPFGYIIARLKGVHIQKVGSGNIGFSNVFRSVGKIEGLAVLVADIAKGLLPVLFFKQVYGVYFALIVGIAAMLGHIFTPFLRFKGGKGVATGLGVFIGLAPFSALFAFLVWMVVVAITRYISLGSMIAAISLPIFIYFSRFMVRDEYNIALEILTILVCLLVIIMHRANIRRLMKGKENKFIIGKKKRDGKEHS